MLTYENFPAGLKQPVRLLYLHPGKRTEQIQFSLKLYSLLSCQYEALSYTWGSVENPVIIKSNAGESFLATRSLASVFFRLRYPDKQRALWADAICINQDDKEEKGQQVNNMFNIYHRASQVLIWLGEIANNSKRA
ncbi:hypothetical protein K432DRAFT_313875 [Lepidopterella palustris CBS 459.81]|uniref:Heterokaryon incompatibility domain-containing protein n=1 Tax=Lepidopterella palustris CBS 459.81 TaxID=1314670 RepID=A0A8E2DWS4_9PEZI|nr:hypothetical protein K432DRAFT_313875 [Lepidopterella palustris CBS 459.81]